MIENHNCNFVGLQQWQNLFALNLDITVFDTIYIYIYIYIDDIYIYIYIYRWFGLDDTGDTMFMMQNGRSRPTTQVSLTFPKNSSS